MIRCKMFKSHVDELLNVIQTTRGVKNSWLNRKWTHDRFGKSGLSRVQEELFILIEQMTGIKVGRKPFFSM